MFKKNEKPDPDLEYFSVFDSKTGSYRVPSTAINRHDLVREFQNMMMDPERRKDNPYYLNAEDFSIFKVAEYDKKSGVITPVTHEHIVNLHDLRAIAQRQQNGALSST